MNTEELAASLAAPTAATVRDALRSLTPAALDALAVEVVEATEEAWRQVVVSRVAAFAAAQPRGGRAPVAAYFTTIERMSTDGMSIEWNPFMAALTTNEDIPDLRNTRTTVRVVRPPETALAQEIADPELVTALDRLALLDPPNHEDVLRVHLPTQRAYRIGFRAAH
jgi:hypothetical protein